MAKSNFSREAELVVKRTLYDIQGPADAMDMAAGYLERGEPIPDPLAKWLAKAFRKAASVRPEYRARVLGNQMGILAGNRRPVGDYWEIGGRVEVLLSFGKVDEDGNEIEPPLGQTKAYEKVAKEFDISVSTARNHWIMYTETVNQHLEEFSHYE
jgi:hypothetical protein